MRLDGSTARRLAIELAQSWRGQIWDDLGERVRGALVDSLIMEHVRAADVADVQSPITPAQLVGFRETILTTLALGVAPRGRMKRRYDGAG